MINEKQMIVLKALRTDARTSLLNLSKKNNISQSTVYDIHKKAEKYIHKYSALLNFNKLGYKFHSFILIKNTKGNRLEIEDYLLNHKNVNYLVKTYDYDFLCEVLFSSMLESEKFSERMSDKYPTSEIIKFNVAEEVIRENFMVNGSSGSNK
jgi:DNA-binding Lrp family transcriptional regulator